VSEIWRVILGERCGYVSEVWRVILSERCGYVSEVWRFMYWFYVLSVPDFTLRDV
jgi:hypothetical protein